MAHGNVGANGRTPEQIKKRWKDVKQAVIKRKQQLAETSGGPPPPPLSFEDAVLAVIGDNTCLATGIPGELPQTVNEALNDDVSFSGLRHKLIKDPCIFWGSPQTSHLPSTTGACWRRLAPSQGLGPSALSQ
ncbi:hypothetical protein ACOMHN_012976 [Nucella lapillus]